MADDSLYYKSTAAVVLGVFWRETEKRVVQISKLLHYSSRDIVRNLFELNFNGITYPYFFYQTFFKKNTVGKTPPPTPINFGFGIIRNHICIPGT
jgi:hypothetical protein